MLVSNGERRKLVIRISKTDLSIIHIPITRKKIVELFLLVFGNEGTINVICGFLGAVVGTDSFFSLSSCLFFKSFFYLK